MFIFLFTFLSSPSVFPTLCYVFFFDIYPLESFYFELNDIFFIIFNCALIVVYILIIPVLTLIKKTSFISAIDWPIGAFHVSLLLLLLRFIWIFFVFVYVPHFGKLRFFNFVFLFSRFLFLFYLWFPFFEHYFFFLY